MRNPIATGTISAGAATLALSPAEAAEAAELAQIVATRYGSSDDPRLLRESCVHAHELPTRLCEFVRRQRDDGDFDTLLIRGHRVSQADLGATPGQWKEAEAVARSLPFEMLTLLHGSLLGDVFGWFTQQEGHVVTDLVPMRGFETMQVGAGSEVELAWHTEDAFHPLRADYLLLTCLRNPARVATSVATIGDALTMARPSPALYRPCVIIQADAAHLAELRECAARDDGTNGASPDWMQPEPTPILTGAVDKPWLCIDPAYMETLAGDDEGSAAVRELCDALDACLFDVILEPGDVLMINNRRVVHGRRPFSARHDGTDRWLKRVNVSRAFPVAHAVQGARSPRVIL
jgi:Fe(II)/alpha-ketoglutarate-dependent arginine beta-hydroxylase